MRRIFLLSLLIVASVQAWAGHRQVAGALDPGVGHFVALPLALARPATPTATPTVTPTPSPTPTPTPAIELLSYSIFRPTAGSSSIYVVGEVRNNSSGPLRYVRARFTFRNAAGEIIASDSALTTVGSLWPGMKSPFQVTLTDFTEPWASVEPYLSWEETSSGPYLLGVTSNTSYYGGGAFHVAGWARNSTAATRTYVEAVATAYDRDGRVVGTAHAYTEPRTVAPGQLTYFDVEMRYYAGKPWTVIAAHDVIVVDD